MHEWMNSAIASRVCFRCSLMKELNINRNFFSFLISAFLGHILGHFSFCATEMEADLIFLLSWVCVPHSIQNMIPSIWAESEKSMVTQGKSRYSYQKVNGSWVAVITDSYHKRQQLLFLWDQEVPTTTSRSARIASWLFFRTWSHHLDVFE